VTSGEVEFFVSLTVLGLQHECLQSRHFDLGILLDSDSLVGTQELDCLDHYLVHGGIAGRKGAFATKDMY
jgi:hypothetical protein